MIHRHPSSAELDAMTALEAETQDHLRASCPACVGAMPLHHLSPTLQAEHAEHAREPRTAATRCEHLTGFATCPNAATTTVTIDGNEYGACDVCAGRGKDEG